MSLQVEARIKRHSKETLIRLTHHAETQIARLGRGVFEFGTVRVERVAVGHHKMIPLADPPVSEDVKAAVSQAEEDIRRGGRLIRLHRKFMDEIRIKTYGV